MAIPPLKTVTAIIAGVLSLTGLVSPADIAKSIVGVTSFGTMFIPLTIALMTYGVALIGATARVGIVTKVPIRVCRHVAALAVAIVGGILLSSGPTMPGPGYILA